MEVTHFSIKIFILLVPIIQNVQTVHYPLCLHENTTCSKGPRAIHHWLNGSIEWTNYSRVSVDSPLLSPINTTRVMQANVAMSEGVYVSRSFFNQLLYALSDPCVTEVTVYVVPDSICHLLDLMAMAFDKKIETPSCRKYWKVPQPVASRARLVSTGDSLAQKALDMASLLRHHHSLRDRDLRVFHLETVSWPFHWVTEDSHSQAQAGNSSSQWLSYLGNVLSSGNDQTSLHQSGVAIVIAITLNVTQVLQLFPIGRCKLVVIHTKPLKGRGINHSINGSEDETFVDQLRITVVDNLVARMVYSEINTLNFTDESDENNLESLAALIVHLYDEPEGLPQTIFQRIRLRFGIGFPSKISFVLWISVMGAAVLLSFVIWKRISETRTIKRILFSKQDLERGSSSSSRESKIFANESIRAHMSIIRGKPAKLRTIKFKSIKFKAKFYRFLITLHEMRHENLNTFYGTIEPSVNPVVLEANLIWAFCARGSLVDVLSDKSVRMDWSFYLSLILDLARGLSYLHESSIGMHGWLMPSKCVIDTRWILKLTDFGLVQIHKILEVKPTNRKIADYLYSSPEVLRNGLANLGSSASAASDIFSFAIIAAEIVSRTSVTKMYGNLRPRDIIDKLRTGSRVPLRPTILKPEDVPDDLIRLLHSCWHENASERPGARAICRTLSTLASDNNCSNLLDNMFHKLETYSQTLEEQVRERTKLLREERNRTEQLLQKILPATVSNQLKMGLEVLPEKFDDATIFFSDIIGFTTISAYSTPFEIVNLLDELYNIFDDTIYTHNVYKVETIGDAYMVVSGVPDRIDNHADEIANMSLDLLHVCSSFTIPHLPNIPLLLRIGINSGPVVAGVVGHTMPRYCLFGDAVNIASRLESTSTAFGIHISSTTKDHLVSSRQYEYQIKYRGEIEIKGRGKQTTYWLLGRSGYERKIPSPFDDEGDHFGLENEELFRSHGRLKNDNN